LRAISVNLLDVFLLTDRVSPNTEQPQAYPTSVDIEALLRSASELRTLDWPNEDPYNPTDSVDKWPPPSPPPLKRSSLTAPGTATLSLFQFEIALLAREK